MISALFVDPSGIYSRLAGVDPWDAARDARMYTGPHPVVAHPPCQRWGKFWAGQPLWIKRTGQRKVKGDDNGCFHAALVNVREFGGVLEHPCDSHAWAHFGLAKPPRAGGWVAADTFGGWTCCVEQGRYGHYARKPTWLYACKTARPELRWGVGPSRLDPALIARVGLRKAQRLGEVCSNGGGTDSKPRIGTPPEFAALLLSIAESAVTKNSAEALPTAQTGVQGVSLPTGESVGVRSTTRTNDSASTKGEKS